MQTPGEQTSSVASSSQAPALGSLKRKRQLLPFGTPPLQTTAATSEQRPVLRVNRACNTCRRQKMRCDGPDLGTPCLRCKNAGVECIFEKVPPNKVPVVPATSSRITSLEAKIEMMQANQIQMYNSIQEILYELRRRPVNYTTSGSEHAVANPLGVVHAPEAQKPTTSSILQPATSSLLPPLSAEIPKMTSNERANPGSPRLPSPLPSFSPSLAPIHSLISPCPTPPDGSFTPSTRSRTAEHRHGAISTEPPHVLDVWTSNASPTPPGAPHSCSDHSRGSSRASEKLELQPSDKTGSRTVQQLSAERRSEEPEFGHEKVQNRERIDARRVIRDDGDRIWNPNDHIKEFRMEDSYYADAIKRGYIPQGEAQELFDLFFERCHLRMPIFDPKMDTFESLRYRSPFCFCCLLMVAAKARDGGNQPSALQLTLWDEAIARAKESMFQRVKDLEVIQGLLLLSAWSESTGGTCWIVAGHAIRCGVEMGIHKALTRMAGDPHATDDEATQVLVSSARVWCALFAFGKLSFGIGRSIDWLRHTMTGHPKSIKNARETLLRHPLSNPSDMRLVSACEIMLLEYQILDSLPSTDAEDPRTQAHLREGRSRMDTWLSEWEALLSPIYPPDHYMRQTIKVQRGYGYMAVHMACMPRIITSADLDTVSNWEKENCFYTLSAAREIIRISVEEESYRDGLRYSPTCFYSGVSFVGATLLRLGSILDGEGEHITSLVTELSRILQDVPTCRFKFSFDALLQENKLGTKRDDYSTSLSVPDGVNSKHTGHDTTL